MRTEPAAGLSEMSDAKVEGFIARIREMRLKMLFGYPSAISHTPPMPREGHPPGRPGHQGGFVTSERLYDHQREGHQPVVQGAGRQRLRRPRRGLHRHACPSARCTSPPRTSSSRSSTAMAMCCPGAVRRDRRDTPRNKITPFVRYRTGDVGVLSDHACPCGRGLPILSGDPGRSTDFVDRRRRNRDAWPVADLCAPDIPGWHRSRSSRKPRP